MSLDVVSLLGSIENLLIKNNTNTADNTTTGYYISTDLQKKIQAFYKGVQGLHEVKPVNQLQYPCVFVEIDSQPEEFAQIGNSARRNIDINFDIVPVTMVAQPAGAEAADQEVIQLAQNIQALIRKNVEWSSTVKHCNITNTEYSVISKSPDTYNNVARITINVRKLSE